MSEVHTIGLDLAKSVFQVHGAGASGEILFRKRLRRNQVLSFFGDQPRCLVAMEACGSAHYWARELTRLGHEVRLTPPIYVKPFVKRQKNDAADAEAICEAASRPTMRFVAVKSEERQGVAVMLRTREMLIRQRTQTINALRGHLAEFGVIIPKGTSNVAKLMSRVSDPEAALPGVARAALNYLTDSLLRLEDQVRDLDREIAGRAKENETARRLMTIPGIGPLIAVAMVALAPRPGTFRRGRDFAAWLGLTQGKILQAENNGLGPQQRWGSALCVAF